MPYKLSAKAKLTDVDGTELDPAHEIKTGETLSLFEFKKCDDGKTRARVRKETPAGSPEGWVLASLLVPLYGQTARHEGLVLEGNQDSRDKCRQLAKRLDTCFNAGNVTGPKSFMMGVLVCETLDGDKVYYAAHAGNWAVSVFETEAKAAGCTPAGKVQGGSEHFRDLSGHVFAARPKPGPRLGKPAGLAGVGPAQLGNWDDLDPPVEREGNTAGTCAAQKMLQLAIKNTATPRFLWEQWYDSAHAAVQDGQPIESCPTCAVNIPRMLDRSTV